MKSWPVLNHLATIPPKQKKKTKKTSATTKSCSENHSRTSQHLHRTYNTVVLWQQVLHGQEPLTFHSENVKIKLFLQLRLVPL